MSKSIAYLKFRSLIEQEIRTFWHVMSALEYAERWLGDKAPTKLAAFPGDDKYPFRAIDITPAAYMAEQDAVRSHIRENALVSFITTFECYLSEILERLIYLEPSLVGDSDLQIAAKELAEVVPTGDTRRWLAAKVADKYLRNKTHREMITRLDKFCKAGVSSSLSSEIEEWSRWSLVRNSIVHTSRQPTPELVAQWASRFPSTGSPLAIDNKELARIHHLAMRIAERIDARAVSVVIKKRDALLLAREIFVQQGISDPGKLRAALDTVLKVKLTRQDMEKLLGEQRRNAIQDRWELSPRDFARIVA